MTSVRPTRTYGGQPLDTRRTERHAAFLNAGVSAFGDKGYSNSSVSDICAEAGLARSQFYSEFKDKEQLLIGVYEHIQTQILTGIVRAVEELPATAEAFEIVSVSVRAILQVFADDPRRARVNYVEMLGVSAQVDEYRTRRRQAWSRFIESTIRHHMGEDYQPPGGHEGASAAFLGALTEVGLQWVQSNPRLPVDDAVQVMTAVLSAFISTEGQAR